MNEYKRDKNNNVVPVDSFQEILRRQPQAPRITKTNKGCRGCTKTRKSIRARGF